MYEEQIVFTRLTHYVPINLNGFLSHEASREHRQTVVFVHGGLTT